MCSNKKKALRAQRAPGPKGANPRTRFTSRLGARSAHKDPKGANPKTCPTMRPHQRKLNVCFNSKKTLRARSARKAPKGTNPRTRFTSGPNGRFPERAPLCVLTRGKSTCAIIKRKPCARAARAKPQRGESPNALHVGPKGTNPRPRFTLRPHQRKINVCFN